MKHPFLAAKGLTFSYGDNQVLDDLTMTVKTSQIVSVVGRSGEGKSTLLHLLVGALDNAYDGHIRIMGNKRGFAKEDIGFVPQEISLMPDLTIAENIACYGSLYGLRKEESLATGRELMDILQLKVPLERHPKDLSGGQRVRLNILVSMLHDPTVIILDEPFAGLDYANRKVLWHFLRHLKNKRKAIILTTHLLNEAEHHTDTIMLIHKGKIWAKGKLSDIRKKLKTRHVVEVQFNTLSKKAAASVESYCTAHDITIMDIFNTYYMFAVSDTRQRAYLLKHLEKTTAYEEIAFREPSLDELFLKVVNI